MPNAVTVTLQQNRIQAQPGDAATVAVTIRNRAGARELYLLRLEGMPSGWASIKPDTLEVEPDGVAGARILLHLPPDTLPSVYVLTVRAVPQEHAGEAGQDQLQVEVAERESTIAPVSGGRGVEVLATPITDVELPPPALQWRLRVTNIGRHPDRFGFCVTGEADWIVVDPPELMLEPNEQGTALLTVYPGGDPGARTFSFGLRTFSQRDHASSTELRLEDDRRARAGADRFEPPGRAATGALVLKTDPPRLPLRAGKPTESVMTVRNRGSTPATVTLEIEGLPQGWATIEPPTLKLPPDYERPATISFRPPAGVAPGSYPFAVLAVRQGESDPPARLHLVLAAGQGGRDGAKNLPLEVVVENAPASIEPGGSAKLAVKVRNLRSPALDSVPVTVDGIPEEWVQSTPPFFDLFKSRFASGTLTISPPADMKLARAGLYSITVRAISPNYAGDEGEAGLELTIPLQHAADYQADLGNAEARGMLEASYPIEIHNPANAPLRVRIEATDADRLLAYKLDPIQAEVPAGKDATFRLTAVAKSYVGTERAIDIAINVQGEYVLVGDELVRAPTRELHARFVQQSRPRLAITVGMPDISGRAGARYEIRVRNPTDAAATILLSVLEEQDLLDWQFEPAELTVPARREGVAVLSLRARTQPEPGARLRIPFQVLATPADGEAQAGAADQVLDLEGAVQGAYQLLLEPQEAHDTRAADYSLRVRNGANAPVRLRFSAVDTFDALSYIFDPAESEVPAGGSAIVALHVAARAPADVERACDFRVVAEGEYRMASGAAMPAPRREAAGAFVQQPRPRLNISLQPIDINETEPCRYQVRVTNAGNTLVHVRLAATDLTGGLDFTLDSPSMVVEPGQEGRATLTVQPATQLLPGQQQTYRFRVTATSAGGETQPAAAEGELHDAGTAVEYEVALEPPEARDVMGANYSIQVRNDAGVPLRLRFSASDPDGVLRYVFDPPQPEVPPHSEALVILNAVAPGFAGVERRVDFRIAVAGQYQAPGAAPVAAPARQISGCFVQAARPRLVVSLQPAQVMDPLGGEYQVAVKNPGDSPVNLYLVAHDPQGNLDFTFNPPHLTVEPRREGISALSVRSRWRPGPGQQRANSFRVTATPADGETEAGSAEGALLQEGTVQGSYRMALETAEARDAIEGDFTLRVRNEANAPLYLKFTATDPDGALAYVFDPPDVQVPPGGDTTVLLKATAPGYADAERRVDFRIGAQGQYRAPGVAAAPAPSQEAPACFIQQPRGQVTISVHPSELTAPAGGQFDVWLINPAGRPVTVRLAAADPQRNLEFAFAPAEVALKAGHEGRSVLRVQARGQAGAGQRRTNIIRITATAIGDELLPATVEARLIQPGPAAPKYSILATRTTPSLIVYLLDVSESMKSPIENQRRIDAVEQALLAAIRKMVMRSTKGDVVSPRYRIAVLAYSDDVQDLLGGIKTVDQLPYLRLPKLSPVGRTDTARAFQAAEHLLAAELPKLAACPAPLVCHMTDGEYNGPDPEPIARRIMEMAVPDGNVLVENIFISDQVLSKPIRDPYTWQGILPNTQLGSKYATKLRAMSSRLPESYRMTMNDEGYQFHEQALMLLPGTSRDLVTLGFQMSAATPIKERD